MLIIVITMIVLVIKNMIMIIIEKKHYLKLYSIRYNLFSQKR